MFMAAGAGGDSIVFAEAGASFDAPDHATRRCGSMASHATAPIA